ncbi:MAG: ABC transporter permease [Gemmatimonadota bacterium]|jgi:putative ABC transport system permease protein|nr:ABC transporter permease [Gemmatimonadota bacterium]
MRTSTLIRVASQSILKNKMRALLTMLGIIIGVGAVIIMVAVGLGARSQIRDSIAALGSNMIVITPGAANTGGVNMGSGSFTRLTVDDVEKIRLESTMLRGVSPVINANGQAVGGSGNWRARINGVHPDYEIIRDWPTISGAWFTEQDVRTNRRVVLLGKTVADKLYPNEDPVGERLRIRNVIFDVIGVLASRGQTAQGQDQDDIVLMPYTTTSARLSRNTFIPQIVASSTSGGTLQPAQEEIRVILREAHKINDTADDFTVRDQTDIAAAASGTTETMSLLLAAIASISLLVGGIGIMNIMLVSVTERTREIGIRMAIGARGGDVLTQFLIESIVMSLLGGLLGLVMGIGGAKLLGWYMGWATEVSGLTVLIAIGFSAAVGIFFGYYPARKAAGLNPIDALRYE